MFGRTGTGLEHAHAMHLPSDCSAISAQSLTWRHINAQFDAFYGRIHPDSGALHRHISSLRFVTGHWIAAKVSVLLLFTTNTFCS